VRGGTTSIAFDHPGYYRIVARAHGHLQATAPSPRGLVSSVTVATLWVFISENGGGVSEVYDGSIAQGRAMMYGAYGPFVSPSATTPPARTRKGGPSGEDTAPPSTSLNGFVAYYDGGTSSYTGTPGQISGTCYGRSEYSDEYDLITPVVFGVGDSGLSTIVCPDGYEYFSGDFSLTGTYANAYGPAGGAAGASFSSYLGTSVEVHVINNTAAGAFKKVEHYAAIAASRFSRSRNKIDLRISDVLADSATHPWRNVYGSGTEYIDGSPKGAWLEVGYFNVVHEYGHAFHRGALGASFGYDACPRGHYPDSSTNLQCAYVEGFADFFAAWIAGDQLGGNSAGVYTDYKFEKKWFFVDRPEWRHHGGRSRGAAV